MRRKIDPAYREYVLSVARAMDKPTVDRVLSAIGPDSTGKRISRTCLMKWLDSAGIGASSRSDEYRRRVIAVARTLQSPTHSTIIAAAGADSDGRTVSAQLLNHWLKRSGISLMPKSVSTFPAEVRATAIEMVMGQGMTAVATEKQLAKEMGKSAPKRGIIAKWCGIKRGRWSKEKRKKRHARGQKSLTLTLYPDGYEGVAGMRNLFATMHGGDGYSLWFVLRSAPIDGRFAFRVIPDFQDDFILWCRGLGDFIAQIRQLGIIVTTKHTDDIDTAPGRRLAA